jgi:hypothetical protein
MVKKEQKPTNNEEQSLLTQFHLDFEHDKTWTEAKKDVRNRIQR